MFKNFLTRMTTHERDRAYALTPEEQILRLFTIGQLDGNFYLDADQVIKNADALLRQALAERPEFASKAAVYAAEELGMKALPTLCGWSTSGWPRT